MPRFRLKSKRSPTSPSTTASSSTQLISNIKSARDDVETKSNRNAGVATAKSRIRDDDDSEKSDVEDRRPMMCHSYQRWKEEQGGAKLMERDRRRLARKKRLSAAGVPPRSRSGAHPEYYGHERHTRMMHPTMPSSPPEKHQYPSPPSPGQHQYLSPPSPEQHKYPSPPSPEQHQYPSPPLPHRHHHPGNVPLHHWHSPQKLSFHQLAQQQQLYNPGNSIPQSSYKLPGSLPQPPHYHSSTHKDESLPFPERSTNAIIDTLSKAVGAPASDGSGNINNGNFVPPPEQFESSTSAAGDRTETSGSDLSGTVADSREVIEEAKKVAREALKVLNGAGEYHGSKAGDQDKNSSKQKHQVAQHIQALSSPPQSEGNLITHLTCGSSLHLGGRD
uniref:Uncharacterized protein n=1 Tax=Pseudictyota dubia TaxID=2749911 RepID=A0A6U2BCM0_9STRA|mmetsp:Transcript_18096/g.33701  ORF Transcript_18096/g.33701 Transcript_18096/m.33701 type:complete len:389 (+) Transcript_18096:38-1204(+)